MQLLAKGSSNDPATAKKRWSLDFLLSPESIHWNANEPHGLSHVKFTRNELDQSDPFQRGATVAPKYLPSGEREQVDVPTSVLFRSVGYRSLPLPGLEDLGIQFDSRSGVIPNDGFGRITTSPDKATEQSILPDGSLLSYLPGLYCAGWVKRGPTGVIATTMTDAFTTAETVAADLASRSKEAGEHVSLLNSVGSGTGLGWEGVRSEAERRGLRATTWGDWGAIDAAEKERGKQRGKLREKFGRVEEMLEVLS